MHQGPYLYRTASNLVMGPYSAEEIIDFFKKGVLTPQDEVCAANSYWFFLHERDEVRHFLGLTLKVVHEEDKTRNIDIPPRPTSLDQDEVDADDSPSKNRAGSDVTTQVAFDSKKLKMPDSLSRKQRFDEEPVVAKIPERKIGNTALVFFVLTFVLLAAILFRVVVDSSG